MMFPVSRGLSGDGLAFESNFGANVFLPRAGQTGEILLFHLMVRALSSAPNQESEITWLQGPKGYNG